MENRNPSVYIIAEAGVNHNGRIETAKELIDVAATAGADAVKFQTFRAKQVISRFAPKADYQKETTTAEESQLAMVQRLELDEGAHRMLMEHCRSRNIELISTPFDTDSVDLLVRGLGLRCIKIPSGEITNGPYLLHIAETGRPVILSTGMSSLAEIETALGVLAFGYLSGRAEPSLENFRAAYCSKDGQALLQKRVTLLHCTTEYPAPFAEANLKAIHTMRKAFGLPVGLSDHTVGIAVPIAAVALGAVVIEKHFTLDRNLPGPDHKASLEPDELKAMISAIRQVEAALGNGLKIPTPAELKNRAIVRKSLVAAKRICRGERLLPEHITSKRPGTGMSPMMYWEMLGKEARNDYDEDTVI